MLLADCIGAAPVRLEFSARFRQGREYYHINYGSPGQFFGIPGHPEARRYPRVVAAATE